MHPDYKFPQTFQLVWDMAEGEEAWGKPEGIGSRNSKIILHYLLPNDAQSMNGTDKGYQIVDGHFVLCGSLLWRRDLPGHTTTAIIIIIISIIIIFTITTTAVIIIIIVII